MSSSHRRGTVGRHRAGRPGLVHCTEHPAVAVVLSTRRRSWLSVLLTPARHSLAGLRRRSPATPEVRWAPSLATTGQLAH
ncbi:hypothetical protein [Rhodococcus sp. X156]|uniref:hypothetical protein n=1 Tax=Rhodococcus sp. X156 TaxID=2499145 RepID=UPI000FD7ED1F|nr:hypothetical protein [Rhodococcus sp. X156]